MEKKILFLVTRVSGFPEYLFSLSNLRRRRLCLSSSLALFPESFKKRDLFFLSLCCFFFSFSFSFFFLFFFFFFSFFLVFSPPGPSFSLRRTRKKLLRSPPLHPNCGTPWDSPLPSPKTVTKVPSVDHVASRSLLRKDSSVT